MSQSHAAIPNVVMSKKPGGFSLVALSAAALCALSAFAPAKANVISGSSSAYGEAVTVGTTPPVGITLTTTSGPLPVASGTAPSPYNNTQTAVSAFVTGVLSTGVLSTSAASNVDGLAGGRSATGSATVNNLAIGVLSILGLTADTVTSTAGISGVAGTLAASGSTIITNLRLNNVLVATANVLPNTVILNAAGVTVTLNEQILTGNGTSNEALSVNAIDVAFTNVAQPIVGDVLGRSNLLNGSIVIGHSDATLGAVPDVQPVPEPASMLMLGGGLLGLAAMRQKRKEVTGTL